MSTDKPGFLAQPVVKNVYIYRNGDPFYEGRRLVINEKRVSTFETFLKEVTGGVQAPFGAVRNIYTPTAGHRVSAMEHIQNGAQYVAAGREKFKKLDYSQIGRKKKRSVQNNVVAVKQVTQSRVVASARFLKPIKEPCLIFVVANGDVLNPPMRLLIPQRQLGQYERVLELVTEKIRLRVPGGVRSLYTFDGTTISDGSELESGQFYVAVGREKFKKLPYSDLIFAKPASMRRHIGSKTASLPPIYRDKKHNGTVGRSQTKSTAEYNGIVDSPTQGDKTYHSQAQRMRMKKRKNGLSMSLGAEDNDDRDQGEEESSGICDDGSGADGLNGKGGNENGTEEPTVDEEAGKDEDVPEPEANGADEENDPVPDEPANEAEEAADGDDTDAPVNGNEEMNEEEEEDPVLTEDGQEEEEENEGPVDGPAPEEEKEEEAQGDGEEQQEQETGEEQEEGGEAEGGEAEGGEAEGEAEEADQAGTEGGGE